MARSQTGGGPPVGFQTVLDVAGAPVYTLDERGTFTYANDALLRQVGYHESELLGEHVSLLMPEGDVRRCQRAVRELLESGGRAREVTVTAETADGDSLRAELSLSLLPLEGGFRGTVGVVRSVDRR